MRSQIHSPLKLVAFIWLLAACSPSGPRNAEHPKHIFKEEFKYFRYINLQKHLGDTLIVENERGKKKSYLISYHKDDRRNVIRELGQGVHFEGTASKYKQVYWINRRLDSFHQVFAFTLNDTSINGFVNFKRQNEMVDSALSRGFFNGLIVDTVNQMPILSNDRAELLKLYSTCLIQSKPWKLVKD